MNISPNSVERDEDLVVSAGGDTSFTAPRACLATLPE